MKWNVQLPPAEWFTLEDPRLQALINEVCDQQVLAIDTETTGLVVWKDLPLYWSLAWGNRRVLMPISTIACFQRAFDDKSKWWVFANAKFDLHMLANIGIRFAGYVICTQVMHALLYEEQSHALDDMGRTILGWKWKDDFKKGFRTEGPGPFLMRLEREDLSRLMEYATNDAFATLKIFEHLLAELKSENTHSLYAGENWKSPWRIETMWDLFWRVERPFTKVLWKCERKGILINTEYLEKIAVPAQAAIIDLEKKIDATIGFHFNPSSDQQKRDYFFKTLKLFPTKFTKGGKSGVKQPSVDKHVMELLESQGIPMAGFINEHGKLSTLLDTYISKLPLHADLKGYVHSRFNQDVARTGRLSSSNPNMQNIPRPDSDRFKLRGAFIPGPGKTLIVGDYEQLEMRLLACASLEEKMIQIFLDGKDIHMGNAEMIFGEGLTTKLNRTTPICYEDFVNAKKTEKQVKSKKLPESAMTNEVVELLNARQAVKICGFGMNYGMKEKKLAADMTAAGILTTPDAAKKIMTQYLDTYPAVRQFFDEAVEITRRTGYSFTPLGRRRFFPEIVSPNDMERFQAERQSANLEIQGGAADVVKMAMILIDEADVEYRYGAEMELQVHDELVFECPTETAEEARDEIKGWMEHSLPTDLAVPLDVSIGIGDSWMNAK